jgi:hypothetical protein
MTMTTRTSRRPRKEIECELEQSGVWDELAAIGDSPFCIACACTELRPCPGGCSWAAVDLERGVGLCTKCVVLPIADLLPRSQAVFLHLAVLEAKAREILTK